MTSLHGDHVGGQLEPQLMPETDTETRAEADRLEMARGIALASLKEDHHALEIDAKLAFGPAAVLGQ
jgi:hypothetical protein